MGMVEWCGSQKRRVLFGLARGMWPGEVALAFRPCGRACQGHMVGSAWPPPSCTHPHCPLPPLPAPNSGQFMTDQLSEELQYSQALVAPLLACLQALSKQVAEAAAAGAPPDTLRLLLSNVQLVASIFYSLNSPGLTDVRHVLRCLAWMRGMDAGGGGLGMAALLLHQFWRGGRGKAPCAGIGTHHFPLRNPTDPATHSPPPLPTTTITTTTRLLRIPWMPGWPSSTPTSPLTPPPWLSLTRRRRAWWMQSRHRWGAVRVGSAGGWCGWMDWVDGWVGGRSESSASALHAPPPPPPAIPAPRHPPSFQVCECLILFMERNEEEFAKFLQTFSQDVWTQLMKVSQAPGQVRRWVDVGAVVGG